MTLKTAPGNISRTLTVLLRAERLIAARRVSVFRRQTMLMVIAGVFVAVAIVMANVAAYQGLAMVVSPALAALLVALGNLLAAGILGFIASRAARERELASAIEMRDMAYDALEHQVDGLVGELRGTAHELRVFARDPLGAILPGAIGPILNALLALLGGKAAQATQPDPAPEETDGPTPAPDPQPPAADPDAPFPEDPASPPQA